MVIDLNFGFWHLNFCVLSQKRLGAGAQRETLENIYILLIRSLAVVTWDFKHKWDAAEFRMREKIPESFFADVSLADVLVPVVMRTRGGL